MDESAPRTGLDSTFVDHHLPLLPAFSWPRRNLLDGWQFWLLGVFVAGGVAVRRMLKPFQPLSDDLELLLVHSVNPRSALLFQLEQSHRLQHAEMPACRRPGATKASGDLASAHSAAAEPHDKQNVPPRFVCERRERGIKLFELLLSLTHSQTASAPAGSA